LSQQSKECEILKADKDNTQGKTEGLAIWIYDAGLRKS